jgi:hypothetical protein
MADNASCLLSLSIPQLLAHFDSSCPQNVPWQYAHPRPEIISSVILALLSKQPKLASFCHVPRRQQCHMACMAVLLDPVHLLQVFPHRYCTGEIAPSGQAIQSCTVEGALHGVGQKFESMGADDPRSNSFGAIAFQLKWQLCSTPKRMNC